MKLLTFEQHFGTSDPKLLKTFGSLLIRELRKALGVTQTEFQRLLSSYGMKFSVDTKKQSSWERGKSLPETTAQQVILSMHRQLRMGSYLRIEPSFHVPSFMDEILDMIFEGETTRATMWTNQLAEVGVLLAEKFDSNIWPLLGQYRAVLAWEVGDKVQAYELAKDVYDMPVADASLRSMMDRNMIGFTFDAVPFLSSDKNQETAMYEELTGLLSKMIRSNPKKHSIKRNLLRVLSRLNKESEFTKLFSQVEILSGRESLVTMLEQDEDSDFANARQYDVVKKFVKKRSPFDPSKTSLILAISFSCLLALPSEAEATDYSYNYAQASLYNTDASPFLNLAATMVVEPYARTRKLNANMIQAMSGEISIRPYADDLSTEGFSKTRWNIGSDWEITNTSLDAREASLFSYKDTGWEFDLMKRGAVSESPIRIDELKFTSSPKSEERIDDILFTVANYPWEAQPYSKKNGWDFDLMRKVSASAAGLEIWTK